MAALLVAGAAGLALVQVGLLAATPDPPGIADPVGRVGAVPPRVTARCRDVASSSMVPVACPTVLPGVPAVVERLRVEHQDLEVGDESYLVDTVLRSAGRRTPFHVLFGGRVGRFDLAVRGHRWPVAVPRFDLRIVGYGGLSEGESGTPPRVRPDFYGRAAVKGRQALVLHARKYPDGGVHGEHFIIVWNIAGNGYAMSLHYVEPPQRRRLIRTLEYVASQMAIV